MADHTYRFATLICCDTCGIEYFGARGESLAREHAAKTFHQVQIHTVVRETINLVADDGQPTYQSPLAPSTLEQKQSREAAEARLVVLYGGGQ